MTLYKAVTPYAIKTKLQWLIVLGQALVIKSRSGKADDV